MINASTERLFWSKVDKIPGSCWEWAGVRNRGPHGPLTEFCLTMGSSWLRTDFSGYTFLGTMFRLERAGQRIDIRIIQGYLGHRSISSTVRYTKLDGRRFAKLF
jgi:integrase